MVSPNAGRRGLILALASVPVAAAAACARGPRPDDNDPWTVVTAYIDAVNAKDADAAKALVDPAYDASDEVGRRITRLGGRDLAYRTLQFHGTEMADLTSVSLTLVDPSGTKTYEDSLSLARSESHWYLILGKHR